MACTIEWVQADGTYRFDTGVLRGCLTPNVHYNGVTELRHASEPRELCAGRTFLNCEYFRDTNTPRRGREYKDMAIPRQMGEAGVVEHRQEGGSVVLRYPAAPMPPDLQFELELAYRFDEERIDVEIRVTPRMAIAGFELFFASYLPDFLGPTAVAGRQGDAVAWDLFGKEEGRARAENRVFYYARDAQAADAFRRETFWPGIGPAWKPAFYALPLVASLRDDGFAVIQVVEQSACLAVAGQHHASDTARDFSVGADLGDGKPWRARACMVVTKLPGRRLDEHLEALGDLHRRLAREMRFSC